MEYPTEKRVVELFEEHVKNQPFAVTWFPDGAPQLAYADLNAQLRKESSPGVSTG